jgi:hypothetical protein
MGRTGKGLPVRMTAHLCSNDEHNPGPAKSPPNALQTRYDEHSCAVFGLPSGAVCDVRPPLVTHSPQSILTRQQRRA